MQKSAFIACIDKKKQIELAICVLYQFSRAWIEVRTKLAILTVALLSDYAHARSSLINRWNKSAPSERKKRKKDGGARRGGRMGDESESISEITPAWIREAAQARFQPSGYTFSGAR